MQHRLVPFLRVAGSAMCVVALTSLLAIAQETTPPKKSSENPPPRPSADGAAKAKEKAEQLPAPPKPQPETPDAAPSETNKPDTTPDKPDRQDSGRDETAAEHTDRAERTDRTDQADRTEGTRRDADRATGDRRREDSDRQRDARDRDERRESDRDRGNADRADRDDADRPDRDDVDRSDRDDDRDRDRDDSDRRVGSQRSELGRFGFRVQAADNGLMIRDLNSSGFAYRAGLRRGDVILRADRRTFRSVDDLNDYLIGRRGVVALYILRDDQPQSIYLDLAEFAADDSQRGAIGVQLQDTSEGVMILGIHRGSPADQAEIEPGEFLEAIDGRQVNRLRSAVDLLSQIPLGETVSLEVRRGNRVRTIDVEVGPRSQVLAGAVVRYDDDLYANAPAPPGDDFDRVDVNAGRRFQYESRREMSSGDSIDELRTRVRQLEAQVERLTGEFHSLRQDSARVASPVDPSDDDNPRIRRRVR